MSLGDRNYNVSYYRFRCSGDGWTGFWSPWVLWLFSAIGQNPRCESHLDRSNPSWFLCLIGFHSRTFAVHQSPSFLVICLHHSLNNGLNSLSRVVLSYKTSVKYFPIQSSDLSCLTTHRITVNVIVSWSRIHRILCSHFNPIAVIHTSNQFKVIKF